MNSAGGNLWKNGPLKHAKFREKKSPTCGNVGSEQQSEVCRFQLLDFAYFSGLSIFLPAHLFLKQDAVDEVSHGNGIPPFFANDDGKFPAEALPERDALHGPPPFVDRQDAMGHHGNAESK